MRVPADVPIGVRRVGEGFGLASVIARVDLGDGPHAASYAVKLCSAELADAEAYAYDTVLPPVVGLAHPRFEQASSDGDVGVVVTEFVAGEQGDVLAGCTAADAELLTRRVARLHAAWWSNPDPSLPRVYGARPRPLTDEQVERCLERHGEVLTDTDATVLQGLADRLDDAASVLDELPVTVLHGDLHLDNVLYTTDGPVLLDWAGVRRGPAVVDVVRCMVEFGGGATGLADVYTDETRRLGVDDPGVTGETIEAALVLAVSPTVRWAVNHDLGPDTREWRLFRFGLTSTLALLAAYSSPA